MERLGYGVRGRSLYRRMRSNIAAGDIWGYQFFHRGSHRVELGGPNSGSLGNKTGHAGSHALAVVLAVTLCAALCVSRFAGTGSRIRDASGPSHGIFFLFHGGGGTPARNGPSCQLETSRYAVAGAPALFSPPLKHVRIIPGAAL